MRYLLALPVVFLAGFCWQLGRDTARRVVIRRSRPIPALPLSTPPQHRQREPASEPLYVAGVERLERWTVQ